MRELISNRAARILDRRARFESLTGRLHRGAYSFRGRPVERHPLYLPGVAVRVAETGLPAAVCTLPSPFARFAIRSRLPYTLLRFR